MSLQIIVNLFGLLAFVVGLAVTITVGVQLISEKLRAKGGKYEE